MQSLKAGINHKVRQLKLSQTRQIHLSRNKQSDIQT